MRSAITWPTETVAVSMSGDAPVTVTFSRRRRDAELHAHDRDLRDLEHDLGRLVLEAVDVRDDRVAARRQRRRDVLAGGVGDGRPLAAGGGVADGDRDARHHRALRVGDRALKRGRGLRPRGRASAQNHADDTAIRDSDSYRVRTMIDPPLNGPLNMRL